MVFLLLKAGADVYIQDKVNNIWDYDNEKPILMYSTSNLNFLFYSIKKRFPLRCIHHFKSDLINDMDHMHISGTEPSSVILSQRK